MLFYTVSFLRYGKKDNLQGEKWSPLHAQWVTWSVNWCIWAPYTTIYRSVFSSCQEGELQRVENPCRAMPQGHFSAESPSFCLSVCEECQDILFQSILHTLMFLPQVTLHFILDVVWTMEHSNLEQSARTCFISISLSHWNFSPKRFHFISLSRQFYLCNTEL